jgi:hypothetical protein
VRPRVESRAHESPERADPEAIPEANTGAKAANGLVMDAPGYQKNLFSLLKRPKNRTTVDVRIHTSAPSCHDSAARLAPVHSTRATANHRESPCRLDDSVNPNRNVTVTDHARPQYLCALRAACGERQRVRSVRPLD